MQPAEKNPPSIVGSILLGQVVSFALAVFYVWVQWVSLPPMDGASKGGFFDGFLDPFVLAVMFPIAVIAGLVVATSVHFVVAKRHFGRSISLVVVASFAWIGIITPFSARIGLLGLLPLIAGTLCFCKFSSFTNPKSANPQQ